MMENVFQCMYLSKFLYWQLHCFKKWRIVHKYTYTHKTPCMPFSIFKFSLSKLKMFSNCNQLQHYEFSYLVQ